MKEAILSRLAGIPGQVSFYYENLVTGESYSYQPLLPLVAASVIKIPIMAGLFARSEAGQLDLNERYRLRPEDKMPSCGCLNCMHDGMELSLRDLCALMIILSDNSATNILIDRLGVDSVNQTLRELGLMVSTLRRRLFERAPEKRMLKNHICAGEMGDLLGRMYRGQLLSPQSSKEMLDILLEQRLGSKIPFLLPRDMSIAHKTGEDDGITHDVGIVYAKQPFIVCFCSNQVDVIAFDQVIQQITKLLFDNCGGLPE